MEGQEGPSRSSSTAMRPDFSTIITDVPSSLREYRRASVFGDDQEPDAVDEEVRIMRAELTAHANAAMRASIGATEMSEFVPQEASPSTSAQAGDRVMFGQGKRHEAFRASEREFEIAAVHVQNAIHNRPIGHLIGHNELKMYKFYHNPWVVRLNYLVILWLHANALFEHPKAVDIDDAFGESMELVCLIALCGFTYAKYYYLGSRYFFKDRWNVVRLIVLALSILDCLVALGVDEPYFRVARLVRPFFFLQENRRLRAILGSIVVMLPGIADISLLAALFVIFFGFFGFLLFRDTEQGRRYFSTYDESLLSLLILVTTANYPDVMMPAYSSNAWNFLYFFVFIVGTLYLLLPLLLAIIYESYKDAKKREFRATVRRRRFALEGAFRAIDTQGKGFLSLVEWRGLMKLVRPNESEQAVELMFRVIDKDGNQQLELDEFFDLVSLLQRVRVKRRREEWHDYNCLCCNVYRSSWRQTLKALVQHPRFDQAVDVLIIISGIMFAAQTSQADFGREYDREGAFEIVDAIFTSLFALEMGLRMFALGLRGYWRQRWNRFDFVVVTASIIASIVFEAVTSSGGSVSTRFLRILLLIRLLRLFRLVGTVKRFKSIVNTTAQLSGPLFELFAFLALVYYSFAVVGMEAFAGSIGYPPNQNPAIIGTTFNASNYFANNFDNIWRSYVTLFELMVVNNWFVIMGGFTAVEGKSARLFFIAFYIVCVVIVLNLISATILDFYFIQIELDRDDFASQFADRVRNTTNDADWRVRETRSTSLVEHKMFEEEYNEWVKDQVRRGESTGAA